MATKTRSEQPGRPGRPPALNADHTAVLRTITQEQPRSSLGEVTRELFRRAGVPVSVDTLHGYVWNDESPVSNALAVYVSYLRRKLGDSRLAVVETMRGVGYRLTRKAE